MDYLLILVGLILIPVVFIASKYRLKNTLQVTLENLKIEIAKKEQIIDNQKDEIKRLQLYLDKKEKYWEDKILDERRKKNEIEKEMERTMAYSEAQTERYKSEKKEIEQINQKFTKEFELIANKILDEKTKTFKETNHQSLEDILNPFKTNIRNFEEKVDKVYKFESDERNTLKGVINTLVEQTKQIQTEANTLSAALKGDNKKLGNWGEMILEQVLERSGLHRDHEYRIQRSFNNEEGKRMQPDVIIDLPEQKHIIIDAKVSLHSYERWVNTDIEEEKKSYIKQHINSIRNHIISLSSKNYCDLYDIRSPEFVLLFIPIESSFSLSVTEDHDIFNFAWDRRVVLVSPSTLLATLRTVASLWKQEKQNRNVLEIAREAGLLYDKFVGFIEDMEKLEKQIIQLSRTHESARKKLDTGRGNMISKIEKLKILGANTSKNLDTK